MKEQLPVYENALSGGLCKRASKWACERSINFPFGFATDFADEFTHLSTASVAELVCAKCRLVMVIWWHLVT